MRSLPLRFIPVLAVVALSLGLATVGTAQSTKSASDNADSRFDLYGGYSYFHPIDSGVNGLQYQPVSNPAATISATGWLTRYIGIQAEAGYFSGSNEHLVTLPLGCIASGCDQMAYTAQGGLAFRYPLGRFVPFIHTLGGGTRLNGPAAQSLTWGWGVTGGIGIDYVLPFFHDHIAVRPIQADFQYSQVVYGPLVLPAGVLGGFGELDNFKLSGGVVFRLGEIGPREPLMLSCTVEGDTAHPGDTVTVTGSTTGLNPKHKTTWTWQSTAGKVTPSGASASIDTTGVPPGDYVVTGRVAQGSKAKQEAFCKGAFSVKQFDPPSLSCAATPATAESGASIDITTTGTSPQNRPLTYSFTTSAGQIASTGATAKLSTSGLAAGPVTVTCNAVDDLAQTATNTTQVIITGPMTPAALPQTQSLCTLNFERDKRRPERVDNESKACLDDVSLAVMKQTDTKLVIVGNASPDESPEVAAARSMNVRQYLTQEKGIDASRIELRVGDTSGRTVNSTLVPAGAIFNDANTQKFDEAAIKRRGPAYGTPGSAPAHVHHHRKAAVVPDAAAPATTPAQ